MSGWNSSERYEMMQRYQSAQAHAFQPFQTPLQEHVGSLGISNFFQPPPGTPIPPPPFMMDMLATPSKRKAVEEIEEDEVQIVAPSAPKKKGAAAAKKPRKKNVKNEKEEDEESAKKNWKDQDVETMISLRGEMEPEFLKNAKKQGMISTYVIFLKKIGKKIRFQIWPIWPFKGLRLSRLAPTPPLSPPTAIYLAVGRAICVGARV